MTQDISIVDNLTNAQPLYNPTFLNLDYLFYKIYSFFAGIVQFWESYGLFIKIFSAIVCLFLIALIVYFTLKILDLHHHEEHKLEEEYYKATEYERSISGAEYHAGNEKKMERRKRWNSVVAHLESDNDNDWRFAIIDADNMLEDLMREEGYSGANLGEMLKSAAIGDFATLDNAWDAHKVRNQIAHVGANYVLPRREAVRTIGNFERVFREFGYI